MGATRSSGVGPTRTVRSVVVGAVLVLLAVAAPASGQSLQANPSEMDLYAWESRLVLPTPVAERLAWVQRSMAPSGLQKLERLARPFALRIASGADMSALQSEAEQGLDAIFAEVGIANMDCSEAAFLVLAMAAKDMDDDLRLIMAEMNAATAAKQKLRSQIRELEDRFAAKMAESGRTPSGLVRNTPGAGQDVRLGATPVQAAAVAGRAMARERAVLPLLGWEYFRTPVIAPLPPSDAGVSAESMRLLLGDLKQRLDGMNEWTEMTSLRLQTTMDRRSKFLETLSNTMNKITSTMESLVRDLK